MADDHDMLRAGIRTILEAHDGLRVVGEASDGAAAVEMVLQTHPDVVLMDIGMPVIDGIEATRRLVAAGSRAQIIVVTSFDHDEHVVSALRAGAASFLLKDAPPEYLAQAVRIVAAGNRLLAPAITHRLIERHLQVDTDEQALRTRFSELTDRELDILRRLARGLSNRDIAAEVFLSEATVKTHITRILRKLGLVSRVQAVVLAYESGLVRPGDATAS